MLRTARSPLKPLWAGLYALTVARAVALIVAPRRTRDETSTSRGSLASGEPLYGLSDIDLVAVTADESRIPTCKAKVRSAVPCAAAAARAGYALLDLRRAGPRPVLAGAYLVNGLGDGRAVFLGPDAVGDEGGLLERPGLHGPAEWRRLRGRSVLAQLPLPRVASTPVGSSSSTGGDMRFGLVARERVCSAPALARRARCRGGTHLALAGPRGAPRRQAGALNAGAAPHACGGGGPALRAREHQAMHRSPPVAVERLLACFVSTPWRRRLVDGRRPGAGATRGAARSGPRSAPPPAGDVALLDWTRSRIAGDGCRAGGRAWSRNGLSRWTTIQADPAALMAAAAARQDRPACPRCGMGRCSSSRPSKSGGTGAYGWCSADRRILSPRRCSTAGPTPTFPSFPAGRLATGRDGPWPSTAPGCLAGESHGPGPQRVDGAQGRHSVSTAPATLGLLLSAARSALFLESVEQGSPTLPLRFGDIPACPRRAGPRARAMPPRHVRRWTRSRTSSPPSPKLVARLRQEIESLPAYAPVRDAPDEELSRAC